ncbi:MAG: 4Fe-4S binding protein [Negativicutes bacterium]|jgi:polyferredoxin
MKLWKSLLAQLPILLISAMFLLHGGNFKTYNGVASFLVFLFVNYLFFMMLRTGKTWKYRAMLFISAAVLFPVSFIYSHIIERGSMLLSLSTVYECKVPFCHLLSPALIIPGLVIQEIPFPGNMYGGYASIASMLVILICAVIVLGRGWCAWGCFYGGWDEGVAQLKKKPSFRFENKLWRLLPWAILIFTALVSAYTLTPIYCQWLCPFKPVTEFKMVTTTLDMIEALVFFSMFVIFIAVLPFLSKKRAQCSFFCPLGPTLLALSNRVNIFSVSIDTNKCIKCKKCIMVCPLHAIDDESLQAGKIRLECAKCGKCADSCPTRAISYHIRGTGCAASSVAARLLFMYAAYVLMVAMLGTMLAKSLGVIFKLVLG